MVSMIDGGKNRKGGSKKCIICQRYKFDNFPEARRKV